MKTVTITVTGEEAMLIGFALGYTSGAFYDGTHGHTAEDNEQFRRLMRLHDKFCTQVNEQTANQTAGKPSS